MITLFLFMSTLAQAQSQPVVTPPLTPPTCEGDIRYHLINPGDKMTERGYFFTPAAAQCPVRKWDWCISAWNLQLEQEKESCKLKLKYVEDLARVDINQCDRLKDGCFKELEKMGAWYRNPWFIGSMGFVLGVAAASVITWAILR